ncbi:putative RNA-binding protein [Cryptosporidium felis]|nr:putative RNA-binding protein [Cryptosporidium felis]
MSENCVFIRNLSPLANKESVLGIFEDLKDEILEVEFHRYPESDQRFCQISFKTSDGVTASMGFNGSTLLGVPMQITVLPPAKIEQRKPGSKRGVLVKNLPVSCSDLQICKIFQRFGNIIGITRRETFPKLNVTIEFQSENSVSELLERGFLILDQGERIELSPETPTGNKGELKKDTSLSGSNEYGAIFSSNVNYQNCSSALPSLLDPDSLNLDNISVPLAYQQIKKIEWENKISKLMSVKKSIEERLLETLNDGSCHQPEEGATEVRNEKSSSPKHPKDHSLPSKLDSNLNYRNRKRSLSRSISPQ